MRKGVKTLLLALAVVTVTFGFNDVYAAKYKYKITYNLDKGTNCANPEGFNKNNKEIVLCNPTRKGYTFNGWYLDGTKVSSIAKKTNKNITLTAKWSKNKYYVKYDANGGKGEEISKSTIKYDTKTALKANTYTKKGYTFVGWNTKADGSGKTYKDKEKVKSLTNKAKKTITLYAMWEKNTYFVKYNSNGGKGSMSNSTLTYDKKTKLRANSFTKTGYTFVGWNTKKDGSGTSYTDKEKVKNLTATADKTVKLYAQWKPVKYKVYYNGNGATSGSIDGMKCTYDNNCMLAYNTFSKSGYRFAGWNTKKNGSGTTYAEGQKVKNLSDKKITLYAVWKKATLSTDKTVVNIRIGETAYVNVNYTLNKGSIYYDNPNKYIAECQWQGWQGTIDPLKITGKKEGTITILITNDVNNEKVEVTVNVIATAIDKLVTNIDSAKYASQKANDYTRSSYKSSVSYSYVLDALDYLATVRNIINDNNIPTIHAGTLQYLKDNDTNGDYYQISQILSEDLGKIVDDAGQTMIMARNYYTTESTAMYNLAVSLGNVYTLKAAVYISALNLQQTLEG